MSEGYLKLTPYWLAHKTLRLLVSNVVEIGNGANLVQCVDFNVGTIRNSSDRCLVTLPEDAEQKQLRYYPLGPRGAEVTDMLFMIAINRRSVAN